MPNDRTAQILRALEPFDLKPEPGQPGKYRSNSPARPGSNSHAFSVTIKDDGSVVACDHADSDKGYNEAQLCDLLSLNRQRSPVQDTKRVYTGRADYAAAQGLTDDDLKNAGWGEKETHQNRPALRFKTETGYYFRFIDGEKPVYKPEKTGYQRCWDGLKKAVPIASASKQPLVIGNGPISGIVGRKRGVAACAITGGEKGKIPADLLTELKDEWSGPVIVAYDCLDAGVDAGLELAAQLRASDIDARAVDLMLGKGGDLADFCKLHGDKAAAELLKMPDVKTALDVRQAAPEPPKATSANVPAPRFVYRYIDAEKLDTLPPVQWLIDGIIPARGLVLLYGKPGIGKSFLSLDIALTLAQNERVIYLAQEGQDRYADDIAAWCNHHHLGRGKLSFLDFTDQEVSNRIPFRVPEAAQAFIDSVQDLQPKLIIIDTLRWALEGDESKQDITQEFIAGCRTVQQKTGAAILLVHHTNRGGEAFSGSGNLEAAPDTIVRLDDDGDGRLTFAAHKCRLGPRFDDRYFALVPQPAREGRTSNILLPTEKVASDKGDLTKDLRTILETIVNLFEQGARVADLVDAIPRLGKSTAYARLSKLKNRGYVTSHSGRFQITDSGKNTLNDWTNAEFPKFPTFSNGLNWKTPK